MFVRTKKIGGKSYAYLVENRWEGGRARQSVTQYLGRVHDVPKINSATLMLTQASYAQAVEALILHELSNHGFDKRDAVLVKDTLVVNPADWTIQNKGKPAVLKLNDGYLCNHTIRTLLGFAPNQDTNGFLLARRLVEAGLAVPKETFVALFEKNEVKQ